MIIDDGHTKTFKKTCKYVSQYLPIFDRYIPKRFKLFLEACGDAEQGKKVVKLGVGPRLIIVKTETVTLSKERVNGLFTGRFPDRIHLDELNAAKFEKDHSKYEIAVQYLLLHEMIHYVRHHAKLPDDDLPDGSDLGDKFEKDAYGRDMSHVWDTGAASFDRGTIKL
jgi:hypothetical protein